MSNQNAQTHAMMQEMRRQKIAAEQAEAARLREQRIAAQAAARARKG